MSTFIRLFLPMMIAMGTLNSSRAFEGRETGNGGDALALEFTTIARQVLMEVRNHQATFPEVDVETFAQAIAETKVISVNTLKLNGDEKDAVNYPERKLIKINRSRWKTLAAASTTKAIVFHEYLGIMKIKDGDYAISGRLLMLTTGASDALAETSRSLQSETMNEMRNVDEGLRCESEQEQLQVFERTRLLTEAIKRRDFSDSIVEYAQMAMSRCARSLNQIIPRDFGDLLHKAHLVIGHRALKDGRVADAKNELLLSCRNDGRTLSSFGPNMTLAQAFLERGISDVVLTYFDACAKYWFQDETLLRWKSEVRSGKIPDFGANLIY